MEISENEEMLTRGASEKTPSIPQYFSWINNTNEGSTEAQTLINLEYFKWLRDSYGMKLAIYAWDAGNLDGSGYYADFDGAKLKAQYPNGYKKVVEKAAESGIRMGVWGGADGFGDTDEEASARHELMVSLCRDYNFALFKFDTVCGSLRPEKRAEFASMMRDCRKYSPDLILLNHRNDLGEAEKYATTFLWGGEESYMDVHMANRRTGMHHRVYELERGLVPGLKRLTEDHGVCISSCIDYFDDALIIQAFARSLILAPEIYGNPWLMRDDEHKKLARIYNLHEKYADILVNGITLPETYGKNAVSRGDSSTRLIVMANPTWEKLTVNVRLDSEIGLDRCDRVTLAELHPYEKKIGEYAYGDCVEVTVMPFRAMMLRAVDSSRESWEYPPAVRETEAPVKLGVMTKSEPSADSDALIQAALFALDNDSLEARSLRRSGESKIPQVNAARKAFFEQETYRYRGCEGRFAFDGNPDTFFDGISRYYGTRIGGGCLRVDFGEALDADKIIIECFSADKPVYEIPEQLFTESGSCSPDLYTWSEAKLEGIETVGEENAPYVKQGRHSIDYTSGKRVSASYSLSGKTRYFTLPNPMDRIYSISAEKDGVRLTPEHPRVNNLMPYGQRVHTVYKSALTIPAGLCRDGSYIAVALEGKHGREGAYCTAVCDGKMYGFTDRAVSFPSNQWEHNVTWRDSFYTYYLPVDALAGKDVEIYTLVCDESAEELTCNIWLCEAQNG